MKYGFLRSIFGEPRGDAGSDLLLRRWRVTLRLTLISKLVFSSSEYDLSLFNLPLIIECATATTDWPHAAPSPLNPSSVPADFIRPNGGAFAFCKPRSCGAAII